MFTKNKKTVFVCDTDLGLRTKIFYDLFQSALKEKGLDDSVQLVRVQDMDIYNQGVVVQVLPERLTYARLDESDVPRIVENVLWQNKPLQDRLYAAPCKQVRIVLRHCGVVDPENISDYIVHDGYQALKKVLTQYAPQDVVEELKVSGLRGRGGGGFPTWMKWKFAREVSAEQKYIICNGDEGDPGAYMDRSVLEGDPHAVLEGMMIAGYTIGAAKGFLYIRAEYPLAIKRVQKAIDQAREIGLLGENILDTGFTFDLEIRLGAGAFVCGEETALIASIEGLRGCPRPRPPYPSVKGLWGMPTVINNVETLANIPVILLKSGAWYAQFGSEGSKGTKVFALTGKVKNSGLIEVPMGISLREIVFDVGGGVLDNKAIKAVQTGGPSGGVIPEDHLDVPVDYEHLQELGSIMGSGGMIVMDEDDCMVDISKFYLGFCVDESCGKCAPCRIGGTQMLGILERISKGNGRPEDLDKLRRISQAMQKASLCGLGQTAANPVLSTLRFFADEYQLHVEEKKCPSRKCRDLLSFTIIEDLCKRCGLCLKNCPVGAISGDRESGYVIDQVACIRCGRCDEVCKFTAVKTV